MALLSRQLSGIDQMYVTKRSMLNNFQVSNFLDGNKEAIHCKKIHDRIQNLCNGLDTNYVDVDQVTRKVVSGLYPGVTTVELDSLAAETCAALTTRHFDYSTLAARLVVSNAHKETKSSFVQVVEDLYNYQNEHLGRPTPLIARDVYDIVLANKDKIESVIDYERDYEFSYFGYKTYDLMSKKMFVHASPTLFNSGTSKPQMSSCFLLTMHDDSIEGIYDTLKECAMISQGAGGIGLNIHNIRSLGTYIAGTNGRSNGIVPMLRVYNNTARYIDQGGNKRPGAFAIYLEPWHPDVFDFVELRKNTGAEESRARDLFYALWIPDLFMRRVRDGKKWTLMDPHECPGLYETWGDEFDTLYEKYEREGRGRRTLDAQTVWYAIIEAQIETGNPFMLYKDACNRKSNHQHLGTIRCSNLCTEIVEFSSKDEIAVCNLASVSLGQYVKDKSYDFDLLARVVKVMTRNLNKVIERNHYPLEKARRSNMRHRPIGIGVQGLADAFAKLRYPFESKEAAALNRRIFETIYFAALDASCDLAKELGHYESYEGSPVSKGILQPDMWGVDTDELAKLSGLDWKGLRQRIQKYGVRNSLLIAPMPTASTAQILGNNESFEPFTSNVFSRRVLSGDFQQVNSYMMSDLVELGLWSEDLKTAIVANQGSIQHIEGIPEDIKPLYKTVWELSQRSLIDLAADRGPFIDQSQSLNLYMAEPKYSKITSMHFYAWKKGLKTGMYYLRTRPAADPIQFTIDKSRLLVKKDGGAVALQQKTAVNPDQEADEEKHILKEIQDRLATVTMCSRDNPDCLSCQG